MTIIIDKNESKVFKAIKNLPNIENQRPTSWKIKELKEHAKKIISVEITQPQFNIWGKWWTINFKADSISIKNNDMLTSTEYRRAYWGQFSENAPRMTGETWQFFIEMLKSKIIKEGTNDIL